MNIGIGISLANYRPVPTAPLEDPDAAIAALFGSGEVGAWYDPSDSSTVFQDAAGTTPAGVGDPVGLILDKSQGLTLGSELEDTANTVAGWTPAGSNTVELDGDAIKITYVDNSIGASLTMTAAGALTTNLTAGKTYRFSADVKVGAGDSVNATIVSATTNPSTPVTNTAFGTLSFYFVADGSNETFRPTNMGTGEVFWIKNISIRELPGNHATQTTSAARPVLQIANGTPSSFGSDLILNGTFDVDANWVKSSATISGGVATLTSGYVQQASLGMVQGKYYRVTLDIVSLTAPGVRVYVGTTSGSVPESYQDFTSTGTKVAVRIRGSTGDFVRIGLTGSGTAVVDNVVVEEVTAWTGGQYYLDFDGVDDWLLAPDHPFTYTGDVSFYAGFQPTSFKTYSTLFSAGTTGDGISNQIKTMAFSCSSATQINVADRPAFATDIWAPSGVYASTDAPLSTGTDYVAGFVISNWSTHRSSGTTSTINGNSQAVTAYGIFDPTSLNSGPMRVGVYDNVALATSFFNFNMYGMVAINRALTAAEITDLETYLAAKSGVTLP